MSHHIHNVVKVTEEVIGQRVLNTVNEDLGKIIEVVLDKYDGRVVYVVLESGTFLGLGGKLFALPWNAFKYDPNQECFILNINKDQLNAAPGFDKNNWPNLADRRWSESIAHFYSDPLN